MKGKSITLESFEYLEERGVFIHYVPEYYEDGVNLNFSIAFTSGASRIGTAWYNDNHEFGNVKETMEASVKLALWYLEKPERIDLINSGYNDPAYIEYNQDLRDFISSLTTNN